MTDVGRRRDVVRFCARLASEQCVQQHVQHEDEQLTEATKDKYRKAWTEWCAWCKQHGIGSYHPTPRQTRLWAEHLLGQNLPLSTIEERLTGMAWCRSKAGEQSPVGLRSVGQPIAAAAWRRSAAQRTAAPISLGALRQIVEEIPHVVNKPADDPRVVRDRCLFTLGWATARCASELVGLDVDDLAFIEHTERGGALLHVKPPAAERLTAGLIVHVAPSDHHESCPVRAARLHVEQRQHGPLFVDVNEAGSETAERLRPSVVDALVKHYAEHVLGQNPEHYSAHSLRAGFVQHARQQGMPEREIANATVDSDTGSERPCDTRWKSLVGDSEFEGSWW